MELHLPFFPFPALLDPSPVSLFHSNLAFAEKGKVRFWRREKGDLPLSLFPTSGTLHEGRVVLLSSID